MRTSQLLPEFEEFLARSAERGELVNTMFEERLYNLVGILKRISEPLMYAGVSFELVGGLAVLVHVEEADPEQSILTRDVDLMVERSELERVREVAGSAGFRYRHAAGVDMLLMGDTDRAANAVHLVFSGEKVRPTQVEPNPPIEPITKQVHGTSVPVIPVADLVRMKLSSYRLKDRVHVQSMDAAGLITVEVEGQLSYELQARLQHVRETE